MDKLKEFLKNINPLKGLFEAIKEIEERTTPKH